jgi:DNA (cytosine-5)-methyltransferase 1
MPLLLDDDDSLTGDQDAVTALTQGLGSGGADAAHAQAGWLVPAMTNIGQGYWQEGDHAGTLTARDFKDARTVVAADVEVHTITGSPVTHAITADDGHAGEDGTGRGTPIIAAFTKAHRAADADDAENWQESDLAPTLDACGQAARTATAIAWGISSDAIDRSGEGAAGTPAERAGLGIVKEASPALRAAHPQAVASTAVRRLTPRECERLQGFPDDHTLVPGTSDSTRYKELGNAVCVNVSEWVGWRINAYENGWRP